MRARAPFQAADLAEMDEALFSRAEEVISMQEVHDGNRNPNSIGLRHDVDGVSHHTRDALSTAVRIAKWEADRGYRSTFFLLHSSPYWTAAGFREAVDEIAEQGHEIGIHTNALAESLRTGRDPDLILEEAIATLRSFGFPVRGVVAHGDPFCNREAGPDEIWFSNDEHFDLCRRPAYGDADRVVTRGSRSLKLNPRPLADFGLEYEALWSAHPFAFRISDSGGKWLNPGWEETVAKWQYERANFADVKWPTKSVRQLHFLWHPDHWSQSITSVRVAV